MSIENIPEKTHISYAGVRLEDGKLKADGGRVLVSVGTGSTIEEAQKKANEHCQSDQLKVKQFRIDIAHKVIQ